MAEDRMLSDEILLGIINSKSGGGGGGGTNNYNDLSNQPQIGGVTLRGNKTAGDLGLADSDTVDGILDGTDIDSFGDVETALAGKQDTLTFDDVPTANSNNPVKSGGVYSALAGKVNTENGKGLSTNDYSDTEKAQVATNTEDIGSLKSGLTNVENELNGDATVYPYADVITIEDAVPSNLADCSVKIEPVQDLHGYDKPWVGGAERNKCKSFVATSATEQYVVALYIETDLQASTQYAISFDDIAKNMYYSNENIFTRDVAITTVNGRNSIIVTTRDNLAKSSATYEDGKGWICLKNQFAQAQTPDIDRVQIETGSSATDYVPYSNICPISGHTEASVQRDGKNQAKFWKTGYINSNGVYTYDNMNAMSYPVKLKGGTACTVKTHSEAFIASFNGGLFAEFDGTNLTGFISRIIEPTTQNNTITFTPSVDCWMVCNVNLAQQTPSAENYNTVYKVQLELGSTATPYEPYQGKTYTIALGDTIYGGTVDFDSGVMTVDRASVDMGTLTWTYHPASVEYTEFFDTNLPNDSIVGDMGIVANIISPLYKTITSHYIAQNGYDNGVQALAQGTRRFITCDKRYSNAADYTNAVDGNILVYELATPTTIQLTPQQIQLLKGTNTLTASTGQISVTANGVSGAIGSVQEQVNGLAEDVAEIKPLNYSTTEQKTGQKWIDGKDIYKRTWIFEPSITLPSATWVNTTIDTTVIEKIIDMEPVSSGGTIYPLACDKNNNILRLASWRPQYEVIIKYITIYYTKTTT